MRNKHKTEVLISIIVPVYNGAEFLQECVASILRQSYEHFELILVDDGSTDNSADICDKYALVDTRVIAVHQANSGVASARNTGLSYATGKYINFVDADDVVDASYLQVLYDAAVFYGADLACCGFFYFGKRGKAKNEVTGGRFASSAEWAHYCLEVSSQALIRGVVAKLFVRRILEENDIRFPQSIQYGEDGHFAFAYYDRVERVIVCEELCYRRRCHDNSLTRRYHEDKVWQYMDEYRALCLFFNKHGMAKDMGKINTQYLELFLYCIEELDGSVRHSFLEKVNTCIRMLECKEVKTVLQHYDKNAVTSAFTPLLAFFCKHILCIVLLSVMRVKQAIRGFLDRYKRLRRI